jgi:hypothetical protein
VKETIVKILASKYFLIALIIAVGFFSHYLLGDDNPVEEYSEERIKEYTGMDIDLTPNSAEAELVGGKDK